MSEDIAQVADAVGQSVVAVQPKQAHAASGILWQEGVIVTANHSTPSDELSVILPGGKSTVAHEKGRDPSTDLAIFSIENVEGTAVTRGDAGQLRVGHLVLALARTRRGNLTASSGIISGLMETWHTWQGGQIDRFVRPDLALYRAKTSGKARSALFEPGLETAAVQRLDLENDLRRALEHKEFCLHYQPIVAMKGGELVGWLVVHQ